jgi:hypothetical protein
VTVTDFSVQLKSATRKHQIARKICFGVYELDRDAIELRERAVLIPSSLTFSAKNERIDKTTGRL